MRDRATALRYEHLLTLTTLTRGLSLKTLGQARSLLASRASAVNLPGPADAPVDPLDFDQVARMADVPGIDETLLGLARSTVHDVVADDLLIPAHFEPCRAAARPVYL